MPLSYSTRRSPTVLHAMGDKGRDRSSDDARQCLTATLQDTAVVSKDTAVVTEDTAVVNEDTADSAHQLHGAGSMEQEHGFWRRVRGVLLQKQAFSCTNLEHNLRFMGTNYG